MASTKRRDQIKKNPIDVNNKNVQLSHEHFMMLASVFITNCNNISRSDIVSKITRLTNEWASDSPDNGPENLQESINNFLENLVFATQVQEAANYTDRVIESIHAEAEKEL